MYSRLIVNSSSLTAQDNKATFADLKNELETGDILEDWPDLSSYTTEACGILLDEDSLDQFMDLSQFLPQVGHFLHVDSIHIVGHTVNVQILGILFTCK